MCGANFYTNGNRNSSWIPKLANRKYLRIIHEYLKYFFVNFFSSIFFSLLLYIFHLKNLPGKQRHSKIYAYSLYTFNIWISYSWILWQMSVNRNNIRQIIIFANRNIIHVMKWWRIGIGIYSTSKYQRIDSWQTICELFANRELFAEHWHKVWALTLLLE